MQAITKIAHHGGQFNVFEMADGSFRVGATHDTAADLADQIGGRFTELARAIVACTAASAALKAARNGDLEFASEGSDI